jgi:hypothetical protein
LIKTELDDVWLPDFSDTFLLLGSTLWFNNC